MPVSLVVADFGDEVPVLKLDHGGLEQSPLGRIGLGIGGVALVSVILGRFELALGRVNADLQRQASRV